MPIHFQPKGVSTVAPYLIVADVGVMLEFLRSVLDVQLMDSHEGPDGIVTHASVHIGDSTIMMGRASGGFPSMHAMVHVYVKDVDAVYQKALSAGATSVQEPTDQYYGDRSCGVKGPQGNQWWFATHIEDLSPEEVQKRARSAKR